MNTFGGGGVGTMTVRGGGATTQAAIPRLAARTIEARDNTRAPCVKRNNFMDLTKPPPCLPKNASPAARLTAIAPPSSLAWSQGLAGLRNLKMNWSVLPRIEGSKTF